MILCCLALLWVLPPANAQLHTPHQPAGGAVWQARDHLAHGRYRLAAQQARQVLYQRAPATPMPAATDADQLRYTIVQALFLDDAVGAMDTAAALLSDITHPAWRDRTALAAAHHLFRKGALQDAIPYYEQAEVGIANLDNDEIADAKFELAYCYFTLNRFDQAEGRFAIIKEIAGDKYYTAGNYYYGLLAYNKGNYPGARKSFERIAAMPQYQSVVPYYMAELDYFAGEKQKALESAKKLIAGPEKSYYHRELHQLAGQVLFEQGKYAEALPYFETFHAGAARVRPEESYELAYTYYQLGNYAKAVPQLKKLSALQDSLGQTAMYLLGDCCLKTGDKRGARSAFGLASGMSYNPALREASLLLHGKLSYEAGLYDEAAASIGALLRDFPNAASAGEARTLRSELYSRTSDFGAAWEALRGVSPNEPGYGPAYRRAAYGLGVQHWQQGNLPAADSMFLQSRLYGSDASLEALSYFWQSEIAYRQSRWDAAGVHAVQFIQTCPPGLKAGDASPAQAYLILGYSQMAKLEYPAARKSFAKARELGSGSLANIARLREADAAMMSKDVAAAATLYRQSADESIGDDARYARLQQAALLGLAGKNADQRNMLSALAASPGAYQDDARLELAGLDLEEERYAEVISALTPIRDTARSNPLAAGAWLKTAQAQARMGQPNDAERSFLTVLRRYGKREEARDAAQELKTMYIQRGEPDAYIAALQAYNLPLPQDAEVDSAYYAAAENKFADRDMAGAAAAFGKYLDRFPNGPFAVKAAFYAAEAQASLGRDTAALSRYDAVLAAAPGDFTLPAAQHAAAYAEAHNQPSRAAAYYFTLRGLAVDTASRQAALAGVMRNLLASGDTAGATVAADTLLATAPAPDTATAELAGLLLARREAGVDSIATSLRWPVLAASRNARIAAEARWYLARDLYRAGDLSAAEAAAVANAKKSAGQEHWVVKSYLLLSDILLAQKDYFNARATLQSIIKNTKLPELAAEAQARLVAVNAAEEQSQPSN